MKCDIKPLQCTVILNGPQASGYKLGGSMILMYVHPSNLWFGKLHLRPQGRSPALGTRNPHIGIFSPILGPIWVSNMGFFPYWNAHMGMPNMVFFSQYGGSSSNMGSLLPYWILLGFIKRLFFGLSCLYANMG